METFYAETHGTRIAAKVPHAPRKTIQKQEKQTMITFNQFLPLAKKASEKAAAGFRSILSAIGITVTEENDYEFDEGRDPACIYEDGSILDGDLRFAQNYPVCYETLRDEVIEGFDSEADVEDLINSTLRSNVAWAVARGLIQYVREGGDEQKQRLESAFKDSAEVSALLDGEDKEGDSTACEDFSHNWDVSSNYRKHSDPVSRLLAFIIPQK